MTPQDLDLTSGTVIHTSQVIAVLSALLVIGFWPGKRGWRRSWGVIGTVLARIGSLLLVLATTVIATALTLNSMLGPVVTSVHDLREMFQTQPDPAVNLPGVPVGDGGLTHYTVTGPLSKYTGSVDVWTPTGYNARLRTKTYPVLFAMHGWPGDPKFLETHVSLFSAVQKLGSEHKMAWPVIVIPQWGKGNVDTECTDGRADQKVETWLAKDLPLWVKANFRVKTGPENWAAYGYSAGAWCSRMLTMLHPKTFGADIDLSGYSYPSFLNSYVPFSPSSPQGQRYNLASILQLDPPDVAMYIIADPKDTNPAEGASYTSTLPFKTPHPPLRVTWVETSGGHSVAAWNPQTLAGLTWLGHTLPGFKA